MEDKPVEVGILKVFSPLDGLKAENVQALARISEVKPRFGKRRCSGI